MSYKKMFSKLDDITLQETKKEKILNDLLTKKENNFLKYSYQFSLAAILIVFMIPTFVSFNNEKTNLVNPARMISDTKYFINEKYYCYDSNISKIEDEYLYTINDKDNEFHGMKVYGNNEYIIIDTLEEYKKFYLCEGEK